MLKRLPPSEMASFELLHKTSLYTLRLFTGWNLCYALPGLNISGVEKPFSGARRKIRKWKCTLFRVLIYPFPAHADFFCGFFGAQQYTPDWFILLRYGFVFFHKPPLKYLTERICLSLYLFPFMNKPDTPSMFRRICLLHSIIKFSEKAKRIHPLELRFFWHPVRS